MTEPPEEDIRTIVARAAVHDPDAWETLYRRAYPRLFSYARRRLPSDDIAEDAVSETMVRALDRIQGFRWKGAGFDAWIYGILRHVVLEDYRNRGRVTTGAATPVLAVPGPLEALVHAEQLEHVRSAVARLDEGERELLELRFTAGLSADEIASVVGRRAGAVRMGQSRALARLRAFFGEADR